LARGAGFTGGFFAAGAGFGALVTLATVRGRGRGARRLMVTSNIVSFAGISGAGKIEAMAGFSASRLAMIQDCARFSELLPAARNRSGCVAVTMRHAGQLADRAASPGL
jgi:hypothetical protein